jgi:hypothetical protein
MSTSAKHPIHLQEVCTKLAQITNPTVQSAMDIRGKKPLNVNLFLIVLWSTYQRQ